MKSWATLSDKVSRPKRTRKFHKLLVGSDVKGQANPLLWAIANTIKTGDAARTISRWHHSVTTGRKLKTTAKEVMATVSQLSAGVSARLQSEAETALLALSAAQAMAAIANKCDEAEWRSALENLAAWAEASQGNRDLMPWVYQLVAVELPLTLSFLLPEFDHLDQMGDESAQRMADSITETLDLDGWPAAHYLPVLAPLVASWTRCALMIRKREFEFDPAAKEQLVWLIPQIFRLLRNDGSLMLGGFDTTPLDANLEARMVDVMDVKHRERRFAEVCRAPKPKQKDVDAVPLQESSLSAWANSGVLQAQWKRRSPKLALDFSDRRCHIEIGRDIPLIAGDTLPAISLNGQTLEPLGDFEVLALEQDRDLDFVELEMPWSGDLTLQRQIILSREEEFLIVADVLLPAAAAKIDYRCDWPFAPGVNAIRETETREVYLSGGKIQSLVLPLALPEWKNERSDHQLQVTDRSLTLKQKSEGAAIYAPLFFDLSPKRSTKQRTWRQLTIAQHLEIVPRDAAVAFRVQVGKQQWILYRALTGNGNRTFMGENFSGEFFLAKFDKHGEVTPLIQIE